MGSRARNGARPRTATELAHQETRSNTSGLDAWRQDGIMNLGAKAKRASSSEPGAPGAMGGAPGKCIAPAASFLGSSLRAVCGTRAARVINPGYFQLRRHHHGNFRQDLACVIPMMDPSKWPVVVHAGNFTRNTCGSACRLSSCRARGAGVIHDAVAPRRPGPATCQIWVEEPGGKGGGGTARHLPCVTCSNPSRPRPGNRWAIPIGLVLVG